MEIEILKSIQMVVYYIEENRVNWIKKQLQDLNIEIDVHFFKCFTIEDRDGYILSKHPEHGHAESDAMISCSRSLFASLDWFFTNTADEKKFVITVEDDSCFLIDDFSERLCDVISNLNKLTNEIDYVTLGYLPYDINKLNVDGVKSMSGLYWNLWQDGKYSYNIYGGQMLLFSRNKAKEVSLAFNKDNTDLIRIELKKRIEMGHVYSYRADVLLADHCLPLVFRQAIYYPPLVIEGNFKTTMGHEFNNLEQRPWNKYLNISNYYINE